MQEALTWNNSIALVCLVTPYVRTKSRTSGGEKKKIGIHAEEKRIFQRWTTTKLRTKRERKRQQHEKENEKNRNPPAEIKHSTSQNSETQQHRVGFGWRRRKNRTWLRARKIFKVESHEIHDLGHLVKNCTSKRRDRALFCVCFRSCKKNNPERWRIAN